MAKKKDAMHKMPGGWMMPDAKMEGMMTAKNKSKKVKKTSKARKSANRR